MEVPTDGYFDRWVAEAEKVLEVVPDQSAPNTQLCMDPPPFGSPAGRATDDAAPPLLEERRRRKKKRPQNRVPQWEHVWRFLSTMIRKRGGSDILASEGQPECVVASQGRGAEEELDEERTTQGGREMELSFRGVVLQSVAVAAEKRDVNICLSVSPTLSWAGESGSYRTPEFKKRMTVLSRRLAERYHRRFGGRVHVQYNVEGVQDPAQSPSNSSDAESTCPSNSSDQGHRSRDKPTTVH